ncbi:hypothetical protein T4D_2037 [Trichinella pseudospiralis]|uniref:Uncharacterized protein n=1 Tax=Trichinella pseudospiralis TaxID=6337 RepID=A0A0V1FQ78_TRIPS|nr:hypothetical protein T4D_2037 [Trichinella pseudospiralis]
MISLGQHIKGHFTLAALNFCRHYCKFLVLSLIRAESRRKLDSAIAQLMLVLLLQLFCKPSSAYAR